MTIPACDRVRPGGLMRCCIDTLHLDSPEEPTEGQVLPCRWCSDDLVYRDGLWEWRRGGEVAQKEIA